MRFIHTADLHLDSPFLGLTSMPKPLWERVHSSTFAAFQKIVDDAIALKVDFVLISGDIYDRDQQSIANDLIKPTSPFIYFMVTTIIKLSKTRESYQQMFMFLAIA